MTSHESSGDHPAATLVFRSCYSTILKMMDAKYDVRGYVLSQLVKVCLENRALVPLARRSYFEQFVQKDALLSLECFSAQLLFGPAGRFSPHEYNYVSAVMP